MNSDFSRLISARWVMSSSSVTAPTSRPSPSRIGVERTRKARRVPPTAHGTTADGLSEATVLPGAQDIGHRLGDARVLGDLVDAGGRRRFGARPEQPLRGGC